MFPLFLILFVNYKGENVQNDKKGLKRQISTTTTRDEDEQWRERAKEEKKEEDRSSPGNSKANRCTTRCKANWGEPAILIKH